MSATVSKVTCLVYLLTRIAHYHVSRHGLTGSPVKKGARGVRSRLFRIPSESAHNFVPIDTPVRMKKRFYLLNFMVLGIFMTSPAQAQMKSPQYQFEKKIALAGDGGWDYLAIDAAHNRLFVSHGDVVNVIDLATETPATAIVGLHGVHGIAIADGLNRGFISNGKDNTVTVFNLSTLEKTASIPVTGNDPDCIVYDPFSRQVFTFNGHSQNATVINAKSLKVTGTIPLGGSPEFAVSDGGGKIFNNLEDKNELVVIDTKANKVIDRYPLAPCGGPSALAIDIRHERLFTACRENKGLSVLNALTGKIITTLAIGSGVDAARFDPSTQLVFASCGDGTVTVIRETSPDSYQVIQTIDTQKGARTMALNQISHKIYLSAGKRDPIHRRQTIPGTFDVSVYQMK